MTENTEWYLTNVVKKELEKLEEGRFTGNMEFKFNWKEGAIANVNVVLAKCIKRIIRPQ